MKKTLFTNLVVLLVMILGGGNTAWADTETLTPTSTDVLKGNHFKVTWAKGSGSNAPLWPSKGGGVRVYHDNTITIESLNGEIIKGVSAQYTINKSSNAYPASFAVNDGSSVSIVDGSTSFAWTTESSELTSVVFTAGSGNGNIQFKNITVTYEVPAADPTDAQLSFNISELSKPVDDTFNMPELNNPLGLAVTYSSSNANVASIETENGVSEIMTLAGGTTVITATLTNAGSYTQNTSASFTLTVSTDAQLSFATPLKNYIKDTQYDAAELTNPWNLEVVYSSSDEDVAVVDNTGAVLTGSVGQAIITATLKTVGAFTANTSASYTINVKEAPQTYSEINLTGTTTPVEFEKAWDDLGNSYSATEQTKTIKSKIGDSYENWKFVNCITGTSQTAHVDWLQMNNKSGRSCKATLPTIKSDYGFKVTVVAVNSNGDVNVKMNGVVGNEYVSNATEATVYIEPSANGAIYISTVTVTPLPAPVVLSDAVDYSPVAATGVNVELNRKMVAGWNGVTLPFAISEDVKTALGASEVKTLGSATEANEAVTLNFVDATLPVAAGTPVLVKLTETKESAFIPNVTIETTAPTTVAKTAAGNTFTLTGNYVSTDLTAEETYFVAGTTFNHKAAGVALTAKPFRAYIVQTAEAGAQARTVRFNLGDGETTGIREVATATSDNGLTYNLQGQRISRATKGVYIVNGKKTIVK